MHMNNNEVHAFTCTLLTVLESHTSEQHDIEQLFTTLKTITSSSGESAAPSIEKYIMHYGSIFLSPIPDHKQMLEQNNVKSTESQQANSYHVVALIIWSVHLLSYLSPIHPKLITTSVDEIMILLNRAHELAKDLIATRSDADTINDIGMSHSELCNLIISLVIECVAFQLSYDKVGYRNIQYKAVSQAFFGVFIIFLFDHSQV